MELGHLNHVM